MTTEKDKILARVRKMLALANDAAATEGERDNALRMAHATLAKYNLDLAEAEAHGQQTEEHRGSLKATFYGRPWARSVANSTAKLFFCEYICSTAKRARDTHHYFVGRQSNAITAAEMSRYLIGSIMREGRKLMRDDGRGNAVLRSFCIGAAGAIRNRVDAIIEERKGDKAPGTALVLASLYQIERDKNLVVFNEAFPENRRTRTRGGKSTGLTDAYAAGERYGKSISLNNQITGSSAPAAVRLSKL